MFMRRMAHSVEIVEDHGDGSGIDMPALPPRTLESIHSHMDGVVLRLGRIPFVDATGLQALGKLGAENVFPALQDFVRDQHLATLLSY